MRIIETVGTRENVPGNYLAWYGDGQVHLIAWPMIWVLMGGIAIGVLLRSIGEH